MDDSPPVFAGGGMVGFGLVLVVLVALVIIGGIKRIAATAEKLVPSKSE